MMKLLKAIRNLPREEQKAILVELAREYWSEEEDNDGQVIFYTGEYYNDEEEKDEEKQGG